MEVVFLTLSIQLNQYCKKITSVSYFPELYKVVFVIAILYFSFLRSPQYQFEFLKLQTHSDFHRLKAILLLLSFVVFWSSFVVH